MDCLTVRPSSSYLVLLDRTSGEVTENMSSCYKSYAFPVCVHFSVVEDRTSNHLMDGTSWNMIGEYREPGEGIQSFHWSH